MEFISRNMTLAAKNRQLGSSMVEFVIVTPMLLFMGLGIMQFGLVYHAKTVLNYATFEAARSGAVNNAQIEVMRKELGYRLAPVYGGDGSLKRATMSLARSVVAVNDITATKIEIINPTSDSFYHHGISDVVEDGQGDMQDTTVIPNSHLRFSDKSVKDDGLTLQDANLLKIKVTYGYQMRLPVIDMKIPGVTWIMRNLMLNADPDNWMYYTRGMLPLTSTATVRMQSEAWLHQDEPPVVRAVEAAYEWVRDQIVSGDGATPVGCASGADGFATSPDTGLPQMSPIETADVDECTAYSGIEPDSLNC